MEGFKLLILLLLPLTVFRCANVGQPEGGARDPDPPIMDTARSTPSLQRNFHPDRDKAIIELKFNEWVKLEDAFKQVIISPPLQYAPKVELKGKGVQVKLDPREILLPQTTYTINFGKAIKDLTESNVVKDLRFVFSTGDIIDTGSVNGKVYDALTGETKEDLLVMLYYSNEDTIIYKHKPIYFSRTTKEGVFNIQNIKDTTYKIIVLEDINSNYLYDQDKESIGFFPRRIKSGEDSTVINMAYYKSYIRPKISSYSTDIPGLIKISSNIPLKDLRTTALTDSVQLINLIVKDTLMIYYLPVSAKNWDLEIAGKYAPIDTILVNKFKKQSLDSFKAVHLDKGYIILPPEGFKEIEWNHPLSRSDTSMMHLIDDTSKQSLPFKTKKGTESNLLLISCPCLESHTYTFTLLPGAIHDYADHPLKDTILLKFRSLGQDEGGSLIIDISMLDSTQEYAVSILQDDKPSSTEMISHKSKTTVQYNHLIPGNYGIQIIEDQNKNGRWDPGDYLLRIQPEKILTQKNYNVRANWELREQLIWKP